MLGSSNIFLIDNGSLRPSATLSLRGIAEQLSARVGRPVSPVSLLHSDQVAVEDLGGVPARVLKSSLEASLESGVRDFVLLPLFLGPSRAVTVCLPELIEQLRVQTSAEVRVVVADVLAGGDVDAPDPRLAEILAAHVRAVLKEAGLSRPSVALVDHGTPSEAVNRVRNAVTSQLAGLLGGEVASVVGSSMERRAGARYDFNEPLLEHLRASAAGASEEALIAALFFLLPGRHAGADGDVARICDGLQHEGGFARVERTPLLGEHTKLLDILEDRLAAVSGQRIAE